MSPLLATAIARIVIIAAFLTAAAVAKALASVLKTWIEQTSRTRRLADSLEGAKPHHRPGIILACGQLEAGSAGGSNMGEAADMVAADQYNQSPMLILETKGDTGHPRD